MNETTKNLLNFLAGKVDVPPTYVGKGLRIPFSKAENDLLIELHKRYGDDWSKITIEFNKVKLNNINRSSKTLRIMWKDYLNPNLPLHFSVEEDKLLREKVEEFGDRAWDKIQRFFPNRSEYSLKNRWNKIINFKKDNYKTKNFTEEEISEIIKIKQDNPGASPQIVTDIFNANHSDQIPRKKRGVRGVLTKARKAGLLDTNRNFQNSTLNQNPTDLFEPNPTDLFEPNPTEQSQTDFDKYSISSLLNPQKDGSFIHNFNVPPLMPNQQNQEI